MKSFELPLSAVLCRKTTVGRGETPGPAAGTGPRARGGGAPHDPLLARFRGPVPAETSGANVGKYAKTHNCGKQGKAIRIQNVESHQNTGC